MKAVRPIRKVLADRDVASSQKTLDRVIARKPKKPAAEDPFANEKWDRDVKIAEARLHLDQINAMKFDADAPITPEAYQIAKENFQKIVRDIDVSFVQLSRKNPIVDAEAKVIEANMNPDAKNVARSAEGTIKQVDNVVKESNRVRGEKATDSLMEQKLGKSRWQTIKDVLKTSAIFGGSIGGIVLLLKAMSNRKSGCFMTDPTSGVKKCNANPDNPSCDGCQNKLDPTCRGQGGNCGTCTCASPGVSCDCVEVSMGDALFSFAGDAWQTAQALVEAPLDFLQFFQKYIGYFVIGIAAFGLLYFMKTLFGAPGSTIQLKK
jgi:hypothetical protein